MQRIAADCSSWDSLPRRLTARDANADALLDLFDFSCPDFTTPPALPTITVETTRKKPAKRQAERRPPQPVQPSGETQQAIEQRQIQTQVTTFDATRKRQHLFYDSRAALCAFFD